jgi:chaperonin GroES
MAKGNTLRPLNDKIVVKRLEAEEMTKGGIVLPDTAKEKPREGKVVSVGGGKILKDGKRAEFQVKKNDRIIFSSYAGTEIKMDGEELLIMSEDDVLAIVE